MKCLYCPMTNIDINIWELTLKQLELLELDWLNYGSLANCDLLLVFKWPTLDTLEYGFSIYLINTLRMLHILI